MVDATPGPQYEPYAGSWSLYPMEPAVSLRKKDRMPFGFAPTNGGKPKTSTPADRRLKENKNLPPKPPRPKSK